MKHLLIEYEPVNQLETNYIVGVEQITLIQVSEHPPTDTVHVVAFTRNGEGVPLAAYPKGENQKAELLVSLLSDALVGGKDQIKLEALKLEVERVFETTRMNKKDQYPLKPEFGRTDG